MTREEAKHLLPVLEAYAKGKVIQWRFKVNVDKSWRDYNPDHHFSPVSREDWEWRIKPEPREWTMYRYKHEKTWYETTNTSAAIDPCVELVRVREILP